MTNQLFIESVYTYYKQHRRTLPWRELDGLAYNDVLYRVIVSEIMLQQTQAGRVIEKYEEWLRTWPTLDFFTKEATLIDVIRMWSGLGYNRRARYLYELLQTICNNNINQSHKLTMDYLCAMPGIGPNTAAAIINYANNQPVPFVETNIRSAYIYSFFSDAYEVLSDAIILDKVRDTMDMHTPREWFYALMDYGTYIKKTRGTYLHKVSNYKKQSTFEGSSRQLRGMVLRFILVHEGATSHRLKKEFKDSRLEDVLRSLVRDKLVTYSGGLYAITNG